MRVATHPGGFHADDVFAIAVLRLVHGDELQVVRSRDPETIAACDLRVDVGGRDDPATGDYDHHQRGGAGERPNGIRYASFGLVWRQYGLQLAGDQSAADAIDERLVQGVDANDTGQTIIETLVGDVRPMSVSGVVAALNPVWDEELTPRDADARFDKAVGLAQSILERELAMASAWGRAQSLVRDAITRADDPRIVELDRNMPWRPTVVEEAPDAKLVMYPKTDGWGIVAVPAQLGSFDNRMDFPEDWAGLSGAELERASGVAGAQFCHPARFYAAAGSREAALALARGALDRAGA